MGRVCNFLSSVSPQQKFEVMDRPVLQLSLFGKQSKIYPQGVRAGQPKRFEERGPGLNFGSSFYMFFLLHLSLPCVNWSSQEGCLFHLRFSFQASDFPLFYLREIFPSLSFSHHHPGLTFQI